MASFDFEFSYRAGIQPLVSVSLAASVARARALDIRWRWRSLNPHRVYVAVDGNSRRLDLLGYRLERDLPLVAESCTESGLSRLQRARVGRGFADMVSRGRHVNQEEPMVLRGVSSTHFFYPPYDYDCSNVPNVHARLATTQDVLVAWNFGEIAAATLLEELHTGCELVLEALVNRRAKRLSFAQLVEAAEAEDLFAPKLRVTAAFGGTNALPHASLLLQLKDLRKDVRHRAHPGAQEWLDLHWEDVAILLEDLTAELRERL